MGNEFYTEEIFNGEECFNDNYKFIRKGIGKEHYCSMREKGRKVSCIYLEEKENVCKAFNSNEYEIKKGKEIMNLIVPMINFEEQEIIYEDDSYEEEDY